MTGINCRACQCRATFADQRPVRFNMRELFRVEDLTEHGWAICPTADCPIYYFAVDTPERTIMVTDFRRRPATKSPNDQAIFCFCFNASRAVVVFQNSITPVRHENGSVRSQTTNCVARGAPPDRLGYAAAISAISARQRVRKRRRCAASGADAPRLWRTRKYCRSSSNAEQNLAADAKLPKPSIG